MNPQPTEPMTLEQVKKMHFAGMHGANATAAKKLLKGVHQFGFATEEAKQWALTRSQEDFQYPPTNV